MDDAAGVSLVPLLRRKEYYVSPSISEMSQMTASELANVENLRVGREGKKRTHGPV